MFTGIVTHLGRLAAIEPSGVDRRMIFELERDALADAAEGDSMCVSGACLTMLDIDRDAGRFSADVSVETLDKTVLGALEVGDPVNLEPALRASDRLGGHLVSGHVDGPGELRERTGDGRGERFVFEVSPAISRYIAAKGSVCIDGVSLTVNEVEGRRFGVYLIPHTLEVTTLGRLQPGDRVNIEVDMIARYVERLLSTEETGP
jgi:riboflavin synthase